MRARPRHGQSMALRRKAILTVRLNDPALPPRLVDGQLRGAFGTVSEIHDLAAQLRVASLFADICDGLGNVCLLYLAQRCGWVWRRRAGSKPERFRIQSEKPRRLRSRIAKLETKLDSGELRRRPCEQKVAVAHGVQSAGAAKGAADLVPPDRFAHMMDDNERGAGSITQAQ